MGDFEPLSDDEALFLCEAAAVAEQELGTTFEFPSLSESQLNAFDLNVAFLETDNWVHEFDNSFNEMSGKNVNTTLEKASDNKGSISGDVGKETSINDSQHNGEQDKKTMHNIDEVLKILDDAESQSGTDSSSFNQDNCVLDSQSVLGSSQPLLSIKRCCIFAKRNIAKHLKSNSICRTNMTAALGLQREPSVGTLMDVRSKHLRKRRRSRTYEYRKNERFGSQTNMQIVNHIITEVSAEQCYVRCYKCMTIRTKKYVNEEGVSTHIACINWFSNRPPLCMLLNNGLSFTLIIPCSV